MQIYDKVQQSDLTDQDCSSNVGFMPYLTKRWCEIICALP